jgi:hypothetical protein
MVLPVPCALRQYRSVMSALETVRSVRNSSTGSSVQAKQTSSRYDIVLTASAAVDGPAVFANFQTSRSNFRVESSERQVKLQARTQQGGGTVPVATLPRCPCDQLVSSLVNLTHDSAETRGHVDDRLVRA